MTNIYQRYVSKELTHFVGKGVAKKSKKDQYRSLISIINNGWLTHSPLDYPIACEPPLKTQMTISSVGRVSNNEMYNPKMICFCDIPVGDLHNHIKKYGCFGLSFLKSFLIQKGANPVFYIAQNSVVKVFKDTEKIRQVEENTKRMARLQDLYEENSMSDYFDKMMMKTQNLFCQISDFQANKHNTPELSEFLRRLQLIRRFLDMEVFSFIKFFDDTKNDNAPDNFYMEREWRILDNLKFKIEDVYRVILPKSYSKRFRNDIPSFVGQIIFSE